jgi:hypothetical protein
MQKILQNMFMMIFFHGWNFIVQLMYMIGVKPRKNTICFNSDNETFENISSACCNM